MAEGHKKISFGFAKSIKTTNLLNQTPKVTPQVDYIISIDNRQITSVNPEEKSDDKPRVIPMLGSKTWHERCINKVNADIYNVNTNANDNDSNVPSIKVEPPDVPTNGESQDSSNRIETEAKSTANNNSAQLSLDEIAAKELMEDLKSGVKEEIKESNMTIPLNKEELIGKEESTQENYEEVPIEGFGLAVLRGMGWKDDNKSKEIKIPELRPMNLGMGADKLIIQNRSNKKDDEVLKLEKGSYVKILLGQESENYGIVEGFNEDAERIIVKMALSRQTISVCESMIEVVSKKEYEKNAKILNAKKYEEHKNAHLNQHSSDNGDDKKKSKSSSNHSKSNDKHSKSKTRHKDKRDNDSNSRHKSTRRKYDSSSDSDDKCRKHKKSKKCKSRSSSSERLSKKSRKKDRERERKRV